MHFHQWKRREFIATLGGALPLANVRSRSQLNVQMTAPIADLRSDSAGGLRRARATSASPAALRPFDRQAHGAASGTRGLSVGALGARPGAKIIGYELKFLLARVRESSTWVRILAREAPQSGGKRDVEDPGAKRVAATKETVPDGKWGWCPRVPGAKRAAETKEGWADGGSVAGRAGKRQGAQAGLRFPGHAPMWVGDQQPGRGLALWPKERPILAQQSQSPILAEQSQRSIRATEQRPVPRPRWLPERDTPQAAVPPRWDSVSPCAAKL